MYEKSGMLQCLKRILLLSSKDLNALKRRIFFKRAADLIKND